MDTELKDEVIEIVSRVPGVMGFASVNFEDTPKKLPAKGHKKALEITETTGGVLIKIALIVNMNISSKTISKEVLSSINGFFSQKKRKLKDIWIYIRGVK